MTTRRKPGGVYKRGSTWWVHYRVNGERYYESTDTADRREAESFLAQRRRELADGSWQPPTERGREREVEQLRARLAELGAKPAAVLTVADYAKEWIDRREKAGVKNVHDERVWLRTWLLPTYGARALADVSRSDVRALVGTMQSTPSPTTGRPYAPRTILHVYNTVRLMFADAVTDGALATSPCTLRARKGELPTKRDADPRWRSQAVYTRAETEALISDERIPFDRRVYYALQLLAGLRAGEAAGRRWRDYDPDAKPLGYLLVHSQIARGEETGTKTGDVREVPVHPALAALLAEWKLHGYAMIYGTHPKPDDLIVPSRAGRDRARGKTTLPTLKEDLERLGFRSEGRARHAMRATFLTLLETDGANMHIASRATHRSPMAPSQVVAGYVRTGWAPLCHEIAKLQVSLRRGRVVPLRRIASGDNLGDSATVEAETESETPTNLGVIRGRLVVGATGFEPPERRGNSGESSETHGSAPLADGPEIPSDGNRRTRTVTQTVTPADVGALAARILAARPETLARVLELLEADEGRAPTRRPDRPRP